jgi:hypothetical protein
MRILISFSISIALLSFIIPKSGDNQREATYIYYSIRIYK